jgi:aryl-alcohol dehydrogenase-like predicted oxidoreductase
MRLGKSGLMVTRVGFGGIPIQRLDEEGAVAVVKRCLDHGVNFIDTANAYSTSEARIGKAIAGRRTAYHRDQIDGAGRVGLPNT